MSERGWRIGLFIGLLLAASVAAGAADNYRLVNGTEEFYYGHVSLVDIKNDGKDPTVLREGATAAEPAILNLPLGPGDTVFSSSERRCEIQFDNGTVLRLDLNTELKIEALMAQSLSARTKISNLVLRRGRVYVMYKQYNSKEMFQVITANAAVKLNHNAVATVGWGPGQGTDVQVAYGRADVLYGPNKEDLAEKAVHKNEKMIVAPDHAAFLAAADAPSDFAAWNLEINKNFDELHKGKTMIPKPVQRLNAAVFYFAQQFGNLYGEWIYDDFFGYVWRPFNNDMRYPNGGWSPYFVGRWSNFNGQMFWVGEEPWGWIPYHLGVWHWDTKRGWYWLPGSAFAPAWVDWAFFAGGFGSWRPWSMWDWGWDGPGGFGGFGGGFYGFSRREYFYNWRYPTYAYAGVGGAWLWDAGIDHPMGRDFWYYFYTLYPNGVLETMYPSGLLADGGARGREFLKADKNQLRKPEDLPFPMPREYKNGLNSLLGALKKGDERAVGSLRAVSGQSMIIGASDLHQSGLHNRVIRVDQFLDVMKSLPANSPQRVILSVPLPSNQNSAFSAGRAYDRGARLAALQAGAQGREVPSVGGPGGASGSRVNAKPAASPVRQSGIRARDWNPDVRIGLRAGLNIVYLSQRNEISVPQLHINSSMAGGGPILTSDGHVRMAWPDFSRDRSGTSSGSGYAAGESTASAGSAGSSGSGGGSASSGGGGGGGHIRN